MNAKRQTIWLVSMLSLMVVLSAYYLFTEDVSQPDLQTAQAITDNGITVTTSDSAMTQGSAATSQDQKAVDQQATAGQQKAANQQKSSDQQKATDQQKSAANQQASKDASKDQQKSAATGQNAAEQQTSKAASDQQTAVKTDAQVLQEMQANATSGSGFFASEQLKRSDNLSKQTEQLMQIITDSKQNTDAVSKAYADLRKIEDQQAKVTGLEESLTKDFPNAFVSQQDNDQWKIIVQSDKLERSQAVSIIDRAINDLNVSASDVSVQYVP
jgi:stage III sporulation protein AH